MTRRMKLEIVCVGGLVAALGACLGAQAATFGTAIAAIRIPTEAVIAADSRVVDGNGKQLPDECKIRVVGETVFSAHGMSTEAATGFNLFELVSRTAQNPGDIQVLVSRIAEAVRGPLTEALTSMRRADPKEFERAVMTGAAAGVILARNEQGSPNLASIRFVVNSAVDVPFQVTPEVRFCPGADCETGIVAIWVTPSQDRLAFQRANPDFWKKDLTKTAIDFVQGEIAKGFPDVGPPIHVIRLIGGRVAWVQPCQSR